MRRRGSEAEIVDEGFWGGSRRRLTLTGSYLVDSLVLAVVILAIATVTPGSSRPSDTYSFADKQLAAAEHAHAH